MLDALTISRPKRQAMVWATVVAAGALVLATSSLALWLSSDGGSAAAPRALPKAAFEAETGIHVIRLAVVGGGGILDVRYQMHAGHAGAEASDLPLALMDEETGLLLAGGVHGHHSTSSTDPDAVLFVLLSNTGGALQQGETASVVVGDVRLEHVPVQ